MAPRGLASRTKAPLHHKKCPFHSPAAAAAGGQPASRPFRSQSDVGIASSPSPISPLAPPPLHTAIRYNKTKHAIANSIACCDVLVARKNPLQWPCRVPPPATKGFSAVWPPGRGTQSEAPPTLIVHHVKDPSLNCRYRGGEALTCSRRASRQAAGEADSTGTRCVRSQQGRPVASRRHGDGPPQAPGSVVHRGGVPRR